MMCVSTDSVVEQSHQCLTANQGRRPHLLRSFAMQSSRRGTDRTCTRMFSRSSRPHGPDQAEAIPASRTARGAGPAVDLQHRSRPALHHPRLLPVEQPAARVTRSTSTGNLPPITRSSSSPRAGRPAHRSTSSASPDPAASSRSSMATTPPRAASSSISTVRSRRTRRSDSTFGEPEPPVTSQATSTSRAWNFAMPISPTTSPITPARLRRTMPSRPPSTSKVRATSPSRTAPSTAPVWGCSP